MTSRERVRKVLMHEIPDRIPNGLGGCETTGLHIIAYKRLQELLGLSSELPRVNTFMLNAVFEQDVMERIESDVMLIASPRMCSADYRGENNKKQWKEQTLFSKKFSVSRKEKFNNMPDGSILWENNNFIAPKNSFYFDQMESTDILAEFEYPDPDKYKPINYLTDDILRKLENLAKFYYENTDYSLSLGETITDLQIAPGGMIGSMILMKEEPEIMKQLLQKSLEMGLIQLKMLDEAVGKYVDILGIAHDFGDNRGVMIGANLWREIYKPYYKTLFTEAKKTTKMKFNLHSCGSIVDILDDLIECGVEIYNPVQISGNGSSPDILKKQFGEKIVFWGGAYDTQLNAQFKDYESVYENVAESINTFKESGGYIFSGVHNLPAEMDKIHIKAMIDAFNDNKYYTK